MCACSVQTSLVTAVKNKLWDMCTRVETRRVGESALVGVYAYAQ